MHATRHLKSKIFSSQYDDDAYRSISLYTQNLNLFEESNVWVASGHTRGPWVVPQKLGLGGHPCQKLHFSSKLTLFVHKDVISFVPQSQSTGSKVINISNNLNLLSKKIFNFRNYFYNILQ